MRIALILISAAALILIGWAVHPGIGILVALLAYGAVDGLRSKPKKFTADQKAAADRKALGYD